MPLKLGPKRPPYAVFFMLYNYFVVCMLYKRVVCVLYFLCCMQLSFFNCFFRFFKLKAKRVSLDAIISLSWVDSEIKLEEGYPRLHVLQDIQRKYY